MRFRNRPQRPNIKPDRLNRRLSDWARSIRANAEPTYGALSPANTGPQRVTWFTITSEALDHIIARPQGAAGTAVWIAKPPDLAGFIASRTLGGAQHDITPAYTAGGKLWAQFIPEGVGIGFASGGDTLPYRWIDQNIDARQWARVPT